MIPSRHAATRRPSASTGSTLKLTNLNKVFYPDEGYTKRDILRYYDAIADLILPHLKDRPLSLKRYPNGIRSEYFFQKNSPESFPGMAAHRGHRGHAASSSPGTGPACCTSSIWAASTTTRG